MPKKTRTMKKVMKKKVRRLLSNYEQNVLLPILMKGLEMKKGKTNAVTSEQIVESLRKHGVRISKTTLYSLINYIRTNDLVMGLMGTNYGYYITNSEQEYIKYEDTLLGREAELRKVRLSIQRQRRAIFFENKNTSQNQRQIF